MAASEAVLRVLVVFAVLLGLALCIWLALLPGIIARKRGHPSAEAIHICGLVGLLIWPAWFVALIWAYTGSGSRRSTGSARVTSVLSLSAPEPGADEWGDLPGTFDVLGVDRSTGMDSRLRVDAESPANARAKGELRGLLVTRVRRIE